MKKMLQVVFMFSVLYAVTADAAWQKYWKGLGADNNWNTEGNWNDVGGDLGVGPLLTQNAYIDAASQSYSNSIYITGNAAVNDFKNEDGHLVISDGASLTIGGYIHIGGYDGSPAGKSASLTLVGDAALSTAMTGDNQFLVGNSIDAALTLKDAAVIDCYNIKIGTTAATGHVQLDDNGTITTGYLLMGSNGSMQVNGNASMIISRGSMDGTTYSNWVDTLDGYVEAGWITSTNTERLVMVHDYTENSGIWAGTTTIRSSAQTWTKWWKGQGSDDNWNTKWNWKDIHGDKGIGPTAAMDAQIDAAAYGYTDIIQITGDAAAYNLKNEDADIVITNGGSLRIGGYIHIGGYDSVTAGKSASLTLVGDAAMTTGTNSWNQFYVGDTIDGTLMLKDSASIDCYNVKIGATANGGDGHVQLDGGTITTKYLLIGSNSTMQVNGNASMVINRTALDGESYTNWVAVVDEYQADGLISSTGFVSIVHDFTESDSVWSGVTTIAMSDGPTSASTAVVGVSMFSSDVLKLVVSSDNPSICYPKAATNLTANTVWVGVGHSDDGSAPFVVTNLAHSTQEGTNCVIYLEADSETKFFQMSSE